MRDQTLISESALSRSALTRRRLLLQAGYTAAGLTLAVAAASNADPTPKIVLGEGDHQYECIHDWLVPPDNLQWGDTQGVVQDAKGNIYVTHTVNKAGTSRDAIVVFDKNGKFLTSWGARFAGGGHGIDIRKEGGKEYIYHCDTAHRQVVKTTLTGDVVWEKGAPQEPGVYTGKAAFVPTNVAFGSHGDFYIADGYGSHWIHQYNQKGDWIRTFGGPGKEPGKFQTPHGIWLDTREKDEPLLVITDRANNRLQYFTQDGKYVRMVTEGIRRPCYFALRGDRMIVADLQSTVTLLDKDNKVITHLGDGASLPDLRNRPRAEFVPGKFIHPHAAKYLHNGDILVVEYIPTGRITLLRRMRA